MEQLTQRQQFWLDHLKRCQAQGQRLSTYAKAHNLSAGALYQSKALFSKRGLLGERHEGAPPFARVCVSEAVAGPVLRLRLRNGVVAEFSGVDLKQLRPMLAAIEAL